jgi:uncharacterized repeat protein (TIGR01451 family)
MKYSILKNGRKRGSAMLFNLVCTVGMLIIFLPMEAFAQKDAHDSAVDVNLHAYKIEMQNGKEKLVGATAAKPGDVIEYRVTYANKSDKPVSNISAVLPIPVGTSYIEHSAQPSNISARTGQADAQYFKIPLASTPATAAAQSNVPVSDYRFVRWQLEKLDAGQNKVVSVRVRVMVSQDDSGVKEEKKSPAIQLKPTTEKK